MEKVFPLGISITLFLSHFCLRVSNTHSDVLPDLRATNASSDQMTFLHWFTVQSSCVLAHFNRSRAASDVNFGRLRASQWEISWARSVALRVLAFKSIPMFVFSCLQMILGFDRNWRNSILTARGVIDMSLPDLGSLTSKNVVWSLLKTHWTMVCETFKFRSIWVNFRPNCVWPDIWPLMSKESFFLEVLLPEIEVNKVLLSIVNAVEEGELFWRYAILRVFAIQLKT